MVKNQAPAPNISPDFEHSIPLPSQFPHTSFRCCQSLAFFVQVHSIFGLRACLDWCSLFSPSTPSTSTPLPHTHTFSTPTSSTAFLLPCRAQPKCQHANFAKNKGCEGRGTEVNRPAYLQAVLQMASLTALEAKMRQTPVARTAT